MAITICLSDAKLVLHKMFVKNLESPSFSNLGVALIIHLSYVKLIVYKFFIIKTVVISFKQYARFKKSYEYF